MAEADSPSGPGAAGAAAKEAVHAGSGFVLESPGPSADTPRGYTHRSELARQKAAAREELLSSARTSAITAGGDEGSGHDQDNVEAEDEDEDDALARAEAEARAQEAEILAEIEEHRPRPKHVVDVDDVGSVASGLPGSQPLQDGWGMAGVKMERADGQMLTAPSRVEVDLGVGSGAGERRQSNLAGSHGNEHKDINSADGLLALHRADL